MSGFFDDGAGAKLPPANLLAEMSLLGALLYNNHAMDRCEGLLPEHFADGDHGRVYAAIVEGVANGHLVDAVSLQGQFPSKLLAGLLAAMVGIVNVSEYGQVIRESAQKRRLIEIGEALVSAAFAGGAAQEISALATRQIDALMMGAAMSQTKTLDVAMDAARDALERAARGETAGISSGFAAIDRRLGGMEPGLVYVLAGRPGMGKSAIAHQIALNVARAGHPVLEFSLEMSATQLGRRALSTASGVPISRMKSGKIENLDAERIVRARKELAGLPLEIDDAAGQSPAQIAIKARAASRRLGKLGLIMVDHLNLMRAEDADARHGGTWATERASATVLQIAKDCGCPVLLLTQLNRGVESREDKRPTLSDLRQAGAIEQDAYAVGFVYRAEYYLRGAPEPRPDERSEHFEARLRDWHDARERLRGVAELIWAKVRDGEPGSDTLTFDAPTATFGEPAP